MRVEGSGAQSGLLILESLLLLVVHAKTVHMKPRPNHYYQIGSSSVYDVSP